jgi:hypothetical protein
LHSALAVIWSATNGIAERTFSEYKASGFPTTRVGDFYKLPADLQSAGGSLDVTYLASIAAAEEAQEHGGVAGDYADGTPRFFSCQSCHMRPVESAGADKSNVEVRKDQPSHFVLNNYIAKDNRIPPWGMSYDVAEKRNVLPVPVSQYGGGAPGSTYNYWDEIDLSTLKSVGAVSAEITLYYQGTSWEYIQFLNLANDGENAFL